MSGDKLSIQGSLNVVFGMGLANESIPKINPADMIKIKNECSTCDYKDIIAPEDNLWCYMFKIKPEPFCAAHKPRK